MENTSADVQPRWKRSRVESSRVESSREKEGRVGRVRARESARCKERRSFEGEKERERVEGWLDGEGWGDRRWLGAEKERRGGGRRETRQRDWRVLDRQKTKVHRGKMAVD